MKRREQQPQSGAALVITVIVVAVLAVVAAAFMQSSSTDRLSSRTVTDYYKAQLAAEAGLGEFMASLEDLVSTNDFTVMALTNASSNAYTAIVRFQTNGTLNVFPLASRTTGLTNSFSAASPFNMSNLFAAANSFAGAADTTNLTAVFTNYGGIEYPETNADALVLNAQLVRFAANPFGTMLYAYVAVDDCAKLNIARFATNSAGAARTNELPAMFGGEMAVADAGSNTVTSVQFGRYRDLPNSGRFGAAWLSIYESKADRKAKNRFYTYHSGEVFDRIPAGYLNDSRSVFTSHADAGKLKYDLNALATNSKTPTDRALEIADIISTNLTNFFRRDPSFGNNAKKPSDPLLRYNRRLAASIVDYIDQDSQPTAITDGEPAGKEALAYPFQIVERYDWISTASNSPTSWTIKLQHTLFVELWNPYTVQVSGNFSFDLETLRTIVPVGGAEVPIPKLTNTVAVSLEPNEIKVYRMGNQDILIKTTGDNPATDPSATPLVLPQTSSTNSADPQHSRFKAFWNEQLYDQTASYNSQLFDTTGLVKALRTLTNANTTNKPAWSVNAQLTAQSGSTKARRVVSDPRQNLISNYKWDDASYTNSNTRWNGASAWPTNASTAFLTHDFTNTWSWRDGMRAPLHVGTQPAANADPTAVASTYVSAADSNNAAACVRNGPMETVAELGHIYDPAHLDDAGTNTSGGDPASYYSAGGARTLRIGQPESPYLTYTQGGQRAMNLLDLFKVRETGSPTNASRPAGININTAPPGVLAAFFYNLGLVSDKGAGVTNTVTLGGATNIATNIVAGRPYYSASEMHRFMDQLVAPTNFAPALAANRAGFADILDRGREEIFRRAYNTLDTKSGAFRFYGIGRILNASGKIESQAALEAIVELRGTTNSTGKPVLKPVVAQKRFL